MKQLEEIIKVFEYLFGIQYDKDIATSTSKYVEVSLSEEEFNLHPNLYYTLVNNNAIATGTYSSSATYFERANKHLIAVALSPSVYNYTYKNLYV